MKRHRTSSRPTSARPGTCPGANGSRRTRLPSRTTGSRRARCTAASYRSTRYHPAPMASNAPRSQSPDVLVMAAPLVVSFWMRSLFTFVDTFYAATLGDAAVAAIGLSIPFEFLMIAVWVGLSTGLTSNFSRAMGAREETKLHQYLS